MPEVFYDSFTFPSAEAIPVLAGLRDEIAAAINHPAVFIDGKTYILMPGTPPTPDTTRDFIRFSCGPSEITLIHDSPGLVLEVNATGPIQNLYRIHPLLTDRGARPRFGAKSWQATMRYRAAKKVRNIVVLLLAVAAGIFVIYRWGWLGILAVVVLLLAAAGLYVVMLAKAFKR